MKITVYTVTDCQFSKQEKEYLKSNNLQFEEKNLETNKDFLTEMLAVGDNFAGTPVTRIEKDDGQSVVLKGFTQEEFDVALGFKPATAQNEPAGVPLKVETTSPVSTPMSTQPDAGSPSLTPPPPSPTIQEPTISEPPSIPTVIEPPQSIQQPSTPPLVEPAMPPISDVQPTIAVPQESQKSPLPSEAEALEGQDEKLSSLLSDLQSKSMPNETNPSPNDVNPQKPASPNMPSIPDPKFA